MPYRHHLGTQMRDARREWSLDGFDSASVTGHLADCLAGHLTSPSSAANRLERRGLVQAALTQLEPIDQEVVVLRHFEDLTNNEVAAVLGLSTRAASATCGPWCVYGACWICRNRLGYAVFTTSG